MRSKKETINLSVFQRAERYLIIFLIRASNHMFGRNIWDKLPEFIFENVEIARVKNRGNFKIFKNHKGDPKHVITC